MYDAVYLRPKEAAKYLRVSTSVLAKMRMRGEGPPYRKFGARVVVYHRFDLDAWMDEQSDDLLKKRDM